MQSLARWLHLALEIVSGALLVALTLLVTVAAAMRYLGAGLSFYDEVAPILLAWLTFFGAALVAMHRGHLGFDNFVHALPENVRRVAFVTAEALVIAFFVALGWGGFALLGIVSDENLVTLPWLSTAVTQAVIPIASAAFVIAELLTIPDAWRRLAAPTPSAAPLLSEHLS
jgi:TRAP-type C4-dicarboxylate transport system permease small subunit